MIENFDKKIIKLMKKVNMPSLSTAIVVKDETVWTKAYGHANIENNIKADENTVYLMASITKSVTATAVMQICEKKLFDLDDDVNDYLPFKIRNPNHPNTPITFRMLLSHTSSLASEEGNLFFKNKYNHELLENFFIQVIPADLKIDNYPLPFLKEYFMSNGIYYRHQLWNKYPPGSEMAYSNIAYGLLGIIVEILSKKSFEDYCLENIFKPLNMNNTSFKFSDIKTNQLAVPYDFQKGNLISLLHYRFLVNSSGGLRTTVTDLSHFLNAFMNGGKYKNTCILKEESVKEMHTVQCDKTNHNFKYGFGWQIFGEKQNKMIFNGGGFWGVYAKMRFLEYDKIGVIYFSNWSPAMNYKIFTNIKKIRTAKSIEKLLFKKAFLEY